MTVGTSMGSKHVTAIKDEVLKWEENLFYYQ
jgi:hypothetical protein